MAIPTANELENIFLQAGQIRLNNPDYANDSNYWVGGHCNWGGSHKLKEDCQSLVKNFGKIESLERMGNELRKCTSKSEFDNQKRIHLTKCDELISGLSNNSAGSCMFGICCIWSNDGMSDYIKDVIEQAKTGINNIKSALGNESYQCIEELNQINLEIQLIQQKMEENKRKAMIETDPTSRAKLLRLIEEDGKTLQTKLTKRAQIENTLNFNASKYVNDLVEAMKRAVEGRNQTGNGGGQNRGGNRNPHNPRTPRNPNNPNPTGPDINLPGDNSIPDPNTSSTVPNQNQQQLFIFAGIALLVIFYLYFQKENQPNQYEYDY